MGVAEFSNTVATLAAGNVAVTAQNTDGASGGALGGIKGNGVWDAQKAADGLANNNDGKGLAGAGLYVWDGVDGWHKLLNDSAGSLKITMMDPDGVTPAMIITAGADGLVNTNNELISAAHRYGFNGATWDRDRNNNEGTLLASAARTASVSSSNVTNYNGDRLLVFLNITAASGTGGLQVIIEGADPISGNRFKLVATPAAIVATGTYAYELGFGPTATGDVQQRTSGLLPRTFRITVIHGDASSYTYSVGYSLR